MYDHVVLCVKDVCVCVTQVCVKELVCACACEKVTRESWAHDIWNDLALAQNLFKAFGVEVLVPLLFWE